MVKNMPAMQEILVLSLGQEDLLEKVMATTPVFLPGLEVQAHVPSVCVYFFFF